MSIILGLVLGGVVVVASLLSAPWWIPVVDPLFSRWAAWVDKRIEGRSG